MTDGFVRRMISSVLYIDQRQLLNIGVAIVTFCRLQIIIIKRILKPTHDNIAHYKPSDQSEYQMSSSKLIKHKCCQQQDQHNGFSSSS